MAASSIQPLRIPSEALNDHSRAVLAGLLTSQDSELHATVWAEQHCRIGMLAQKRGPFSLPSSTTREAVLLAEEAYTEQAPKY